MRAKLAAVLAAGLALVGAFTGAFSDVSTGAALAERQSILVAAAASLEYAYTQRLILIFEAAHPDIRVEGTYDSSGKLQTQIEEGLQADVFMSASTKQMNALAEAGLMDEGSVRNLLENRIVLIAPADSDTDIDSFGRIAEAGVIALGDPQSVPAGQYAKEALTSIGVWDAALSKASLGTNVTEVLNWVAEGSADVGIVYATDAATTARVKVLCEAPEGGMTQGVIYPVGVLSASSKKQAAQAFVDFLTSDEALAVFESYGFARADVDA